MTLPAWRGKLHGAADGAPPGPYAPGRRYRAAATGRSLQGNRIYARRGSPMREAIFRADQEIA